MDLNKIIDDHERWVIDPNIGERANLIKANLSGADLSRTNLSRANMFKANLSGANLQGAILTGAILTGADLSEANLSGANLTGTYLQHVKGLITFCLGEHFGYAWKKNPSIIVMIGCEEHTLDYWLDQYKRVGEYHDYNEATIEIYYDMLCLIKKHMESK